MSQDELKLKVLRALERNPDVTQRELSSSLDVSLGAVNYCLKALLKVGLLKAENFSRSSNKRGYIYLLTPSGVKAKADLTLHFLKMKRQEYEILKLEIEKLAEEVEKRS